MEWWKILLIVLAILLCLGIAFMIWANWGRKPFSPSDLQQGFNLQEYVNARYWAQYAYIPNWFQKQCSPAAIAEYNFVGNGQVSVTNRCIRKDNGQLSVAEGIAYPYGNTGNKLKVSFAPKVFLFKDKLFQKFGDVNVFTGDYYILDSDSKTYAMVGSTDRKYLWFLVRPYGKEPPNFEQLKAKARYLRFDIDSLVLAPKQIPDLLKPYQ